MAAPWSPSPQQASYYQQCFDTADMSKSGRIQGGEAVKFMMRSGVQPGILKEVRPGSPHTGRVGAHALHVPDTVAVAYSSYVRFPPLRYAPLPLVTFWTPRTPRRDPLVAVS